MEKLTKQKAVLNLLVLDFIRIEKELQEVGWKIIQLQNEIKKDK